MKSKAMRFVSLLLVIAMLAAMPVVAFAEAGVPLGHTHNDWYVDDVVEPDCSEEDDGYGAHTGYTTRVCRICGYEEEEVLGTHQFHKYVLEEVDVDEGIGYIEADDGEIGYWELTCQACEDTIEVLDHNNQGAGGNYKLGHSLNTYVQNPTCVDYGFKIQKCIIDGCEYEEGAIALPPTGHTWAEDEDGNQWKVVREATSTTQGLKQRTCKICGAVDTLPIDWTKPEYDVATISADYTMLREDSNASAAVLNVALRGSRFKVVSKTEDGSWFQVETTGGNMWVAAANANLNSSSKVASTYAGALKYSTVAEASGAKIHSAPNAASATTSSLKKYTPVFIYLEKDGFARVERKSEKWIKRTELGTVYTIMLGMDGTKDVNHPNYNPPEHMEDETVPEAPAAVVATGVVETNTPLNVRREAEISILNVVGSLANGTKVDIYKIKEVNGHDWGRILYKGAKAWICLDYVNVTPVTGDNTNTDTSTPTLNATIVNCATGANVRKTPGTTGTIIGTAPVRSRVAITEFDVVAGVRWGKAYKKGWICMDYVALDPGAEDAIKGTTGEEEKPLTTYTKVSVPAYVIADAEMYSKAAKDGTSKKLMTIKADASKMITVTDRSVDGSTNWCKVTVGSVTGWVDQSKLRMPELLATVSNTTINVYTDRNIDSKIEKVLGKDSVVTIEGNNGMSNFSQTTDGVFLWGQLSGTTHYVRMDQLSNIKDSSTAPNIIKTVSIPATVLKATSLYKTSALTAGEDILILEKDRTITITDLKFEGGKYVGKTTVGNYTGWFEMAYGDLTNSANWNVKQDVIKGTVSADAVNAYSTPGYGTVELILRKGQNINVVMRIALDRNIWGLYKLNGKFYWSNLQGVTLAGEVAPTTPTKPATPSTPTTPTTPTTPPASASAAGTIVNAKSVNVRTAPGVRNTLATTLTQGTKVTVYEQKTVDGAMWGRIDQGWVAMAYVDLSTKGTSTGSTIGNGTILTSVPAGSVAVGFVNTAELTVRSGAGLSYGTNSKLTKGTNVVIHEQVLKDGMIWGRIDQGWICTSYVTLTATSVTGSGTQGIIKGCFYTANIRSAAGVGNALVGKIMVNSQVEIYEQKEYSGEMWGRTSIGWIAMQYVLIGSAPVV